MNKAWRVLVAVIALVVVITIGRFFFIPQPKELRVLARDWQEITFQTTIGGDRRDAPYTEISNITGTSLLTAQTQYITASFPDAPDVIQEQDMTITAEGVQIQLIEVSGWTVAVDFDASNAEYFLLIDTGVETLQYRPAFERLPSTLAEHVFYQSKEPELLTLRPSQPDSCCQYEPPGLQILADQPTLLSWYMRRGCSVSISRSIHLVSRLENELISDEYCPAGTAASNEHEGKWDYYAVDTPLSTNTMVVLTNALEVQADDILVQKSANSEYLILITSSDESVHLTARPQGLNTNFSSFLLSTQMNTEEPLAKILPTSKQVTVIGLVGKVGIGLQAISTSELSQVQVGFQDWPTFVWENQVVTSEDGRGALQQFLSGTGRVNSAVIDGEQISLSRWGNLAVETRGAIIGGLLGAMVPILAPLFRTLRQNNLSTNQVNASTTPPVFQVDVPLPVTHIIHPSLEVQHKHDTTSTFRALVIASLLGFVVWVWRRTNKP